MGAGRFSRAAIEHREAGRARERAARDSVIAGCSRAIGQVQRQTSATAAASCSRRLASAPAMFARPVPTMYTLCRSRSRRTCSGFSPV
ncbi:hypothetical protein WR25_15460 [Diploscapter pachys]|uniref:Uncharacterized protein n=1 Tax=Diploscapter pachys TaxID=2018661 RepID=A0A2A2M5Z3_9BILA|nr:hypothetical protein WR25_15460 [Diploscapter pachys]